MKKGILIACAVIAAAAIGAGVCWALADSPQTEQLARYLDNEETLTPREQQALDRNGDGKLNGMDMVQLKLDSLTGKGAAELICPATTEYVQQMGRTYYEPETKTLWFGLSGSGVSFTVTGTKCELTLVGDSTYSAGETAAARYAIEVNGERVKDAQVNKAEETVTVWEGTADTPVTVKVIKLSESAHSLMGVRDIVVNGSAVTPTERKAHLIEFIGDSITCGYGVDKEEIGGGFQTLTEDATKAYAYRTAQQLDADCSLVSYSGHGIISGYTTGGKLNTNQLVPPYYDKIGFSYGTFSGGKKLQEQTWDFGTQPDLVVINLGTNDASYTGSDSTKQKEFTAGYVAFLKTVREKNPDAPILCTLGIMGQTLCQGIKAAVEQYTAETGDTNISTLWFDVQSQEDGIAVDWHPSAKTHQKAADKLTAYIKEWLGW